MLLYMSNATTSELYDDLFKSGKVHFAYQMQKFNHNIILGLSEFDEITALSALPYVKNYKAKRIDQTIDKVHFVAVRNSIGKLHKPMNVFRLYKEGCKTIKKDKPKAILCDAIAKSPCVVSKILGKKFNIPVFAIVTDLPGLLGKDPDVQRGLERMKGFDGYVLLTEQMNDLVNEDGKPYIVMEGLSSERTSGEKIEKREKTIVYAGSLWEKKAGIEYFVKGFLDANLEGHELLLYGKGELIPWIEQISLKNPTVKYMGCVPNDQVLDAQRRASLLINPRPSDEEFCKYSFPSKTIEYMLSGTPVLMTKLPGVPKEYFEHVYTIDEEDEVGVKKALIKIFSLTEQERLKFSMSAREFILNEKNIAKQSGKIHNFINQNI